mmetsp:Transcript_22108/g.71368  ORF Transcript_22108/g.71368 Transcript_22108/m.71368 type:complete len:239 (+) Transcript_22108:282-998(+)
MNGMARPSAATARSSERAGACPSEEARLCMPDGDDPCASGVLVVSTGEEGVEWEVGAEPLRTLMLSLDPMKPRTLRPGVGCFVAATGISGASSPSAGSSAGVLGRTCSSSTAAQPSCPWRRARSSGVQPSPSVASASAPRRSSRATHRAAPVAAATCRGVRPATVRSSRLALCRSSSSQQKGESAAAAAWMGARAPSPPVASPSAPPLASRSSSSRSGSSAAAASTSSACPTAGRCAM